MKRSMLIALTMVVILSLALIAAGPPPGAKEKHPVEFTAAEKCVMVNEGEKIDQDGWVYFKGQEWKCQLISADAQIAGEGKPGSSVAQGQALWPAAHGGCPFSPCECIP